LFNHSLGSTPKKENHPIMHTNTELAVYYEKSEDLARFIMGEELHFVENGGFYEKSKKTWLVGGREKGSSLTSSCRQTPTNRKQGLLRS
jgi:hypothetical protein